MDNNNRRKLFTIQEGHYTGPKDLEDGVPGAFGTITKSTLAGIGIGGVAGKLIDDNFKKGAKLGGKTGFVAGVLIKLLLNSLHNPMNSVKYQEVDKHIRSNFGINRVSGFTFGDNKDNRAKLDKSFAFNSRYLGDFKIIVAIQNNQVTLYTQDLSDFELKSLSETLDYYCKKYYGMNYNSKLILSKNNSYSISIIFTNYNIISDFLVEVSEVLNTRINILDNKTNIEDYLINEDGSEIKISTPKLFSEGKIDKFDLMRILGNKGCKIAKKIVTGGNVLKEVLLAIIESMNGHSNAELMFQAKKDLNNDYLLFVLKNKLKLIKDLHFTTGNSGKMNMRLHDGVLIITVFEKSSEYKSLKSLKVFAESDYKNNGVKILVYKVNSKLELENILKKIFNLGVIPNIFMDEVTFEEKTYSNMNKNAVKEIVEKLEKERIEDFEVREYISNNDISINTDLDNLEIYIPKDADYIKYDIEDFISDMLPYSSINQVIERKVIILKVRGKMRKDQYLKLIKFIIEEEGFVVIMSPEYTN
jgi:hypothetical protein